VDTLLEGAYFSQAVIAAENFAEKFPEELSSNFLAGKCLVILGDHARAQGYLEKTVDLEADLKTKNGKSTFETILTETMFLLGMVHLHGGDDEKAMEYFGKTLELDPDNANANNNLGYLTLENNGDLKSALRLIRRAIRIKPGCGEFLDSLGWAYFKMGKNEKAITALKDALQLRPQPEIYNHLGRIYQSMGQIHKARREWEKALQMNLEYQPARDRLEESYDLEERI
jgi:tetratricopeptide (TPR) repeat protein